MAGKLKSRKTSCPCSFLDFSASRLMFHAEARAGFRPLTYRKNLVCRPNSCKQRGPCHERGSTRRASTAAMRCSPATPFYPLYTSERGLVLCFPPGGSLDSLVLLAVIRVTYPGPPDRPSDAWRLQPPYGRVPENRAACTQRVPGVVPPVAGLRTGPGRAAGAASRLGPGGLDSCGH